MKRFLMLAVLASCGLPEMVLLTACGGVENETNVTVVIELPDGGQVTVPVVVDAGVEDAGVPDAGHPAAVTPPCPPRHIHRHWGRW